MSDVSVDKWKQEGRFYLWKYLENTRNFPGWHLTADELGCHNFVGLIEMMLSARWSSQKTLAITPPTKGVLCVPNNRGGEARWESPAHLILKYPKDRVADEYFEIEERRNEVDLSLGQQKLELLRECVLKILEGEGDYAIGSREMRLWFWWT